VFGGERAVDRMTRFSVAEKSVTERKEKEHGMG
jgi:hypothetical protein